MGRKEAIEKWIDLSELPRDNRNRINWKESVGYKCKFKYDNIEGEIEIIDYIKEKRPKLIIKYLDYDLFQIQTGNFSRCNFGKLLKKITNEFKVEIGQEIKDNRRHLIIIGREYRENYKYYKYYCNKCGNEDIISEGDLLNQKSGCNVCNASNPKAKLGFNTIYDKARWMCDLGVSEEDAKKYTPNSHNKIKVKCPNCEKEKEIRIYSIYNSKSIGCSCSDGISYPEKFISNLLNQLNINYIKEYYQNWSDNKKYDFYFELNNKKCIIETHGGQHYNKNGFNTYKSRNLEEELENDKYKKELALDNGVDFYIELDCRESNLEWIKNSILNSELNRIFDLNNINWLKCEEFALSNRVKEVCDYWKEHNEINNEGLTTTDLSKVFNLNRSTIRRFLNKGNNLGWCNYNPKYETFKKNKKLSELNKQRCSKKIEVFKNGQSLGVFESCKDLEKQSDLLFKIHLNQDSISAVAKGERKTYKGFTFKYVEDKE